MKYLRKNIYRITELSLLVVFITAFVISEIGYPIVEKEYPATNDYCLIIKDADLNSSKTVNLSPLNLKADITLHFVNYNEEISDNLYTNLKTENNLFPAKTSKIYLYDRIFLI